MSGDKIIMDSEELTGSGNTIQGNSSTFGGMVTKFYSHINTMTSNGVWTGEDASEMASVAESMRNDLDTITEIINELGTDFISTAAAFEDTVDQNRSKFGQI